VVLNYCTPDDTAVAIASLRASRRAVDDIFVVDNGSRDGSADALRLSCPEAIVIESETNLGFAAGANLGVRQALDRGAGLVLLVNSDTIVPPDTIERLEAALDDPSLGIVAPVVLAREHPSRVGSCGMRFAPATGRMVHPEAGTDAASLDLPSIHPVDGVSGCAMLVRRDVFERAGVFDEGYFFFFEDLDLCLRAAGAGLKTACVTTALSWHEGSRSIGRRSPSRLYYATRGHLRLARTAGHPSAGRAAWRSLSVVALNLAHALAGSSASRPSGVLAVARGVADELGGRAVRRP
jgi:GT2 family glycosyltransferase